MEHRTDRTRYIIGVAFAAMVFLAGFYALVIYEYELVDLVKGAFISLMTLACQFVFGEALASSVARRQQQSYDAGKSSSGPTVNAEEASVYQEGANG